MGTNGMTVGKLKQYLSCKDVQDYGSFDLTGAAVKGFRLPSNPKFAKKPEPRPQTPIKMGTNPIGPSKRSILEKDLAEHKKTCKAKPGNCPYEKKVEAELEQIDHTDNLNVVPKTEAAKAYLEKVSQDLPGFKEAMAEAKKVDAEKGKKDKVSSPYEWDGKLGDLSVEDIDRIAGQFYKDNKHDLIKDEEWYEPNAFGEGKDGVIYGWTVQGRDPGDDRYVEKTVSYEKVFDDDTVKDMIAEALPNYSKDMNKSEVIKKVQGVMQDYVDDMYANGWRD